MNEIDVTVRGFVGHNPTLMRTDGKVDYLRVNVASTSRVRDRDGQWNDGPTQWFAVKFFGDFAAHVATSVRKGDAVLVRGRLEHEEYTTREGQLRWSATIVADAFGPDLRFAEASVRRVERRSPEVDAPTEGADPSPPVDVSGYVELSEQDESDLMRGGADGGDAGELADEDVIETITA